MKTQNAHDHGKVFIHFSWSQTGSSGSGAARSKEAGCPLPAPTRSYQCSTGAPARL